LVFRPLFQPKHVSLVLALLACGLLPACYLTENRYVAAPLRQMSQVVLLSDRCAKIGVLKCDGCTESTESGMLAALQRV
jgi:hypothetical protein